MEVGRDICFFSCSLLTAGPIEAATLLSVLCKEISGEEGAHTLLGELSSDPIYLLYADCFRLRHQHGKTGQ